MIPINALTASEVAAKIRSRDLSVEDVAQAVVKRVNARDSQVHAFSYFDSKYVLEQARFLDVGPVKSAIHGVPVGIKDVIDTKDMPTGHHSSRYSGSRPGVDAACVDTLRAMGALLVGKTVTTEFAASSIGGPTRNPLDLARTPGGSSSGSAAAVADFQCAIAMGTQTGGSIIRPASFTGIYGWKPTWNSVSREGVKMVSATCDTVGFYSRSADDLSLLADIFDLDALDEPGPASLAGMRVAVVRSSVWPHASPATQDALAECTDLLRAAGTTVVDLEMPAMFETIQDAFRKIISAESHSAFLNESFNNPELLEDLRATVERRGTMAAADYRNAYKVADTCRAAFDDIAAEFDVILTPSATGEAPVGIEWTGDAVFNSMWTLLQVPVVNVPGLTGPDRMPVGISLTARRYQDRKVIAIAKLVGALLQQKTTRSHGPE